MGIRFRCHQCGHELHVKDFQGGKRSKCPDCETRFQIPLESGVPSLPLENSQGNSRGDDLKARSAVAATASGATMDTLAAKSAAAISTSSPARNREPDVESQYTPQQITSAGTVSAETQPAQPQAILEAPDATWYVRPPAGGQYGPAPAEIFCEWLTENRVTRDSLVWRDGWPQWLVASDVFEDYFGPTVPQILAPTTPSPTPNVPPATDQSFAPEFIAPISLNDRALAARKRQRKKNYVIMIGILATIAVGLVVALVAVLMLNT